MQQHFLNSRGRELPPLPDVNEDDIYPQSYFLYGSYVNPTTLPRILAFDNSPTLHPAKIVGYKIMLWRSHQVLAHAPRKTVHGLVYEVQSYDHAEKIQRCYEHTNQDLQLCDIRYGDESWVIGKTFMWERDTSKFLLRPTRIVTILTGYRVSE